MTTNIPEAYLLHSNQVYPLMGTHRWTLGRSDRSAIVLSDAWVSRLHAMVQRNDRGEYRLIDLGSRNGSHLNGQRINLPTLLQDGDEIALGETHLIFRHQLRDPAEPDRPTEDWAETETAVQRIRCPVSVLVVDILGHRQVAAHLEPDLLCQVVGTWFRQMGEILQRFGCHEEDYRGDSIQGIWVHSTQGPQAIGLLRMLRAIAAADRVTANLFYQYPLPSPLQIKVGLHTDYALVGYEGQGDRPDYTSLEPAARVARDLEHACRGRPEDLLVGSLTYSYLDSHLPDHGFTPLTLSLPDAAVPIQAGGTTFRHLREILHLQSFTEPPTSR